MHNIQGQSFARVNYICRGWQSETVRETNKGQCGTQEYRIMTISVSDKNVSCEMVIEVPKKCIRCILCLKRDDRKTPIHANVKKMFVEAKSVFHMNTGTCVKCVYCVLDVGQTSNYACIITV